MISRDNYEEYFLLYADDELSASERFDVEQFVKTNPDLLGELHMLSQLKLNPEQGIYFDAKKSLFRNPEENSFINSNNYKEWFLLYADDALDKQQKSIVEEFIGHHTSLQQEFDLILQARMEPDYTLVFPGKGILYRKKERKIIFLPWMRIAAAAIVLLLLGFYLFNNRNENIEHSIVKKDLPANPELKTTGGNKKEILKSEMPVTSSFVDSLNTTGTKTKNVVLNNPMSKSTQRKNKIILSNKVKPLTANPNLQGIESPADVIAAKVNGSIQRVNVLNTIDIKASSFASLGSNLVAVNEKGDALDSENNVDGDDKIYIANTSAKKNKFRGFFRKVSRALTKNARVENDDQDAILVGSFKIASK